MANYSSKRTIIISTVCIIYLLLIIFYFHIDKYTTGILFFSLTLLIAVTFVVIIVYFIKGLLQIYLSRYHLSLNAFIPILICLLPLTYTFFSPYRIDSERLEGKIVLRACFEGTQNQAVIKFRENKKFEIHWTGAFLADSWYFGTYKQKADTFYLDYTTKKPYRFGDTIFNNNTSLITLNKIKIDSEQYFVAFYLGYCKGLN